MKKSLSPSTLYSYHICNLLFLEIAFFWSFVWVPCYKVFAVDFCFSFVHTLLVCFTRFLTLEKISDNNQTEWKLVNDSDLKLFLSKNHQKGGRKYLQSEFALCLVQNIVFLAISGNVNISQECAWKVSKLCHYRSWSFFQKKVVRRWWRDAVHPRSISLAALLRITWCCYEFYSMPTWFSGVSAARSRLCVKATCQRSPQHQRGFMHDCDVNVPHRLSPAGSPCFWHQKLLWRHFSRSLNFYVTFYLLWWAPKGKKISFSWSQIKLWCFIFLFVKNEFNRRTGSNEKSSSKILLLVAVALYIYGSVLPCVYHDQALFHLACHSSGNSRFPLQYSIAFQMASFSPKIGNRFCTVSALDCKSWTSCLVWSFSSSFMQASVRKHGAARVSAAVLLLLSTASLSWLFLQLVSFHSFLSSC